MMRIAFIGLGSMGRPMATNLVRAGFHVRGFDVRSSAVDAFVRAGGGIATSAAEAAESAEVLVLMVLTAQQAEQVLFAEGVIDRLAPRATVIVTSTCPPHAIESMAERVTETQRQFVDAPVSGGTIGAEGGTLTIMAAASAETLATVKPVLAAMGRRIFHVGDRPGQGATIKTIAQLLVGVHTAVAAEALALASKVGIADERLLEILGGSSAASWMLNDRGPAMLKVAPPVTSTVDIFVKDLGIVLEAGQSAKLPLPLAAIARQLFIAASGAGHGPADYSQVIRAYLPNSD